MESIYSFTNKIKIIRLLCTFPVQWNPEIEKYEKLPLKWFYLFNICILIGSMCAGGLLLLVDDANFQRLKMTMELSQLFGTIIILLYCYFTGDRMVECMNSYYEIDKRMKVFGAINSYRNITRFTITKYSLTMFCIILNNIGCIKYTNQNYLLCARYFMTYNLTFLISSSVLSHFSTFVLVGIMRLQTLNNSISNLVLRGRYDRDNRYDKLLYDKYDLGKSLRFISTIHWDIIKLEKQVNNAFAFQVILMFIKTFITVLTALHSLVKRRSGLLLIYDLFWSSFTIAEVIYMLQVCTECINMSKRSIHLVNILHSRNDTKLNSEKQMFLLQCLHQKMDFSALGLFPIHKTVFLKFCASIVTYVTLILQFENLKQN